MVTSHDVARLAGVSQPTVSRALRDMPGMSAATRTRIREAARALGYVTSQTGRSLSSGRTRRIGVVAADLSNPFYPALISPLHDELEAAGYRTILITDRGDDDMDLQTLLDGSLDGVVLTTATLQSTLPMELSRRGISFVMVNREVAGISAHSDTCVSDNRGGVEAVADLLHQLGHHHIAAVFGPRDTSTGREREYALRDALAARGLGLPPESVRTGPFAHETGYLAMKALAASASPPTAVFCANDVIAFGALNAAKAIGVDVPRQMTIIGFDDIFQASWERIDLTTVRVDLKEMARRAAGLLLDRIADPDRPPVRHVSPTSLVLRGTHGPPGSPR